MTRSEFIGIAQNEGIDRYLFDFDVKYKEDTSVVLHEGDKWLYCHYERGGRHGVRIFSSESDALEYMLKILHDCGYGDRSIAP
jgi:hypothetical protein